MTTKTTTRRWLAASIVSALVLSACGSSGGSSNATAAPTTAADTATTAAPTTAADTATTAAALPDVPPLSDLEMRSNEKEVLGYYVHSHPLGEHKGLLDTICTHGTATLAGVPAKGDVLIGGLVSA
jgi:DNA polymerase III alpha subunit